MQKLPPALEPLGAYRQFIIWKSVPAEPKPRKVPIDARTIEPCDPHNPVNWMDADTAITTATLYGPDYGVGFVLGDSDPFWFLDLDHCKVDGGWNATANELMGLFDGCAVEVSYSGAGLHILGSGLVPDHSSRNGLLGLEFYHTKRFIALTGIEARGNVAHDTTLLMPSFIGRYFPPHARLDEGDEQWNAGPVPEWSGPADDDELIERMLGSINAANAFTGRASFADLWHRNVQALSVSYPDPDRDYDASGADAGMAQHLAYWTGKDCARMERIMRRSGLVRDKWDRRENGPGYLRRTIARAAAKQEKVYQGGADKPLAPPPPPDIDGIRGGLQYLTPENQREHFKGCVYVRNLHRVWCPDGSMLKPEQFNATYGGYIFALDNQADKTTRKAFEAFTETQALTFPKVAGPCFRPKLPPGQILHEEGSTLVNTYVPIETVQQDGDPSRFLEFMSKLLPDERDRTILISFMASVVQNPGVKFQWAPLIQGVEGNGKTALLSLMAHCVGHRYTHIPNAKELSDSGGRFNGWVENKLILLIEEIFVGERREFTESMKPLVTNPRIEIQKKGQDQYTGDNFANLMLTTNHKDAMRVTFDTRRYCILFTAQQETSDLARDGMDGRYFPELYDWLREEGYAIMNRWLRQYDIPDEFNPATSCQRAPVTSSTQEAVSGSLGAVEQEVLDRIEEGGPGFSGGWVSSIALDRLLADIRSEQKIPRNKRRALMERLGYRWHPLLPDGRVNNPIAQEGGKPKLYIRRGHPAEQLETSFEVVQAYMLAQSYAVG